jgi:hypothetical protein
MFAIFFWVKVLVYLLSSNIIGDLESVANIEIGIFL